MKIVVFGDQQRVGALQDGYVVDLNRASERLPARLDAFIAGGQATLDEAQRAIERSLAAGPDSGLLARVADVKLHAPWPMRRIACVGGNYAAHLIGMEAGRGGEGEVTLESITQKTRAAGQWGFWKVPEEVAGSDDAIPYPSRTEYFDYEGEAAIIIGKRIRDASASQLADCVWGVTLLNDWSIRDGITPSGRPLSYNLAKNFDRSTSMGPCVVVNELDPQNVDVQLRVNGALRQDYNTRDMIFSFGEVLEYLSRDFTFVPGDVIAGGTSVGTAADQTKRAADGSRPKQLFLKVGDVVELSSPSIGVLANRIVVGSSAAHIR
jgi:2-keto-4-pentenoate hydratase/2-oxohepta-3-ene-1,7-dioic acid hydratase in catechol pathway